MKVLNSKVKPEAAIPLQSGTMIQQYRLTKVLGIGGFSVVYCAEDTETGDVVAIKEFYSTNCMRRRKDGRLGVYPLENKSKYQFGIKRFFDEGFTLSQMDHPNIVKVCNFFRYNDTAYLVMDFQRGKDLRWFIKNTDIMPDETFMLTVFSMILAGLKEMHNKNFLHLDIKPSNVLLRTNGYPLLLDLGASFLLDEKRIPKLQTLTHGYSSPEQHERKPLSYASDLYSVAMAMRACITHATPQSAAKRVKKDFVQPLIETHANRFRVNFLRTIDAASDLDASKRPQDVEEFISGLTAR